MSLAALLSSGTLHAQSATGFSANRFEPSERGSDWFANESLDLQGEARPAAGVVGDYVASPLTTRGDPKTKIVSSMFGLHLGGAINLVNRFRFALNLPVVPSSSGQSAAAPLSTNEARYVAPSGGSVGDLRFGPDVRVGGAYGDPFTIALGFRIWAPTGSESAYTGDGKWRFQTKINFAGEIGLFTYAAHVGYGYRGRRATFEDTPLGGNEIVFGAALGAKVLNKKLVVGPEIFGLTWLDTSFQKRTTPVEALLGAHYTITPYLRAGAGLGTGITSSYGSPDFRGLFSIEFFPEHNSDRDGDGVRNEEDACPDVKGVASDDPDKNGCPPKEQPAPPDRDKDGVLDADDACPDTFGVKTKDPKTNGCPLPSDKDGDGVIDSEDACPEVSGIKTDDPKTNGCPSDRDGDGVIDREDACPDEAGLKTQDPKTNGCPDPDRDKDGIPNADDACPDDPGPSDPDPKRNGCPKAFVKAGQIKILDQVKFKSGSAQIDNAKDSTDVLQAVLKVLTEHAEIKKVRVEGHTDNQGGAAMNKKLSADRAASVVKWLVQHGIDKARLTSQGFGFDKPIADNKTPAGRKDNRRVEFHIESDTPPSQ